MVHWQQLRGHHPCDLETLSYPHAVPFKKSGSSVVHGAVGTGLGEGQNTLKLKKSIQLYMERDGAPIKKSVPGVSA